MKRKGRIISGFIVLGSLLSPGRAVFSAPVSDPSIKSNSYQPTHRLAPNWLGITRDDNLGNVSFVNSIENMQPPSEEFIDAKTAAVIKQTVSDQERAAEQRKQYGLFSQQDQLDQMNRMKALRTDLLKHMERYQLKTKGKRAKQNAENNESFESVRVPLTVMAAAAAVSTGTPVKFRLGDFASFNARGDLVGRRGTVSMKTFLVNGAVEYDGRAPDYSATNPNAQIGREQYRFRLTRDIPLVDCSTDFVYGASSGAMNAQLSRKLVENVTAAVSTSRGVQQQNAARASEQTFRLLYGIQF